MSQLEPRPQSRDEFRKEFRKQIYTAVAAGVIAGAAVVGGGVWAYVQDLPERWGVVPKGAVVAFWATPEAKQDEYCPVGWRFLPETDGRMIVGAGVSKEYWQEYIDGSISPNGDRLPFTPRNPRDTGGEEMHKLTIKEIPSHTHNYDTTANGPLLDNPYNIPGHANRFGTVGLRQAGVEGGGGAHNNMPPYVAMFYCRKL